jgi:hypothetical protein
VADFARQADLTIWGIYVQAVATEDERLADHVGELFTSHFRGAFDAWAAEGRPTFSPFAMAEYLPPGAVEAAAADAHAAAKFTEALDKWAALGIALVLLVTGVGILVTFPAIV